MDAVEAVTRGAGGCAGRDGGVVPHRRPAGRALVRLSHVPLGSPVRAVPVGARRAPRCRASWRRWCRSTGDRRGTVRTQTVQVLAPAGGGPGGRGPQWRSSRRSPSAGRPSVCSRCGSPDEPGSDALPRIGRARAGLGSSSSPTGGTPTSTSGVSGAGRSLSAEIQRRLLGRAPARRAPSRSRRGWSRRPSIGGATFDYSLARDVLHLSITDAMGHGWGRPHGHPVRRRSADRAAHGATLLERAGPPTPRWWRTAAEQGGATTS